MVIVMVMVMLMVMVMVMMIVMVMVMVMVMLMLMVMLMVMVKVIMYRGRPRCKCNPVGSPCPPSSAREDRRQTLVWHANTPVQFEVSVREWQMIPDSLHSTPLNRDLQFVEQLSYHPSLPPQKNQSESKGEAST
jgi:Ca2+/Na+ antiporter